MFGLTHSLAAQSPLQFPAEVGCWPTFFPAKWLPQPWVGTMTQFVVLWGWNFSSCVQNLWHCKVQPVSISRGWNRPCKCSEVKLHAISIHFRIFPCSFRKWCGWFWLRKNNPQQRAQTEKVCCMIYTKKNVSPLWTSPTLHVYELHSSTR